MRSIPYLVKVCAVFAGFWWVFTGGDWSSWLVGIPAVMLAGFATSRLNPVDGPAVSWWKVAKLMPYFIRESLRGGLNVGLRIIAPQMPLDPGWVVFTTRLRSTQSRVFFLTCVNLLPGTLVARLDNCRLRVHVLDNAADLESELSLLEDRIARVFGEELKEQATWPL